MIHSKAKLHAKHIFKLPHNVCGHAASGARPCSAVFTNEHKTNISRKQHKLTMQIVVATVKTLLVVYDKNKNRIKIYISHIIEGLVCGI